jgi:hypothetical protein
VIMVETLQRAWSRSGNTGTLEERWDAAVARIRKVNPNYLVGGPRTETNLDILESEIARLTKPVDVDSPALHAATAEVINLESRYHRAWCDVRELQQKLRRSALDPVHKLLGNLPDDLFQDVGPPIDSSNRSWPRFRSIKEARAAAAELLPRVLSLEGRRVTLVDASRTAAEPDEVLNRKLILKMWDRVQALAQKVEQLSLAPAVQNGAVRTRARELSSSGHSTREIAAIVGVSKSTVANYLAEKER